MSLFPLEWLFKTAKPTENDLKKRKRLISAKCYVIQTENDEILNVPSYIDADPK